MFPLRLQKTARLLPAWVQSLQKEHLRFRLQELLRRLQKSAVQSERQVPGKGQAVMMSGYL